MSIPRIAAVVCLVLALAANAQDVPPAPDGFSWHAVPELRASLLVPNGWSYREERDAHLTLAMFVTEKPSAGAGELDVGLTVNAFVDDPNAPEKVKKVLDEIAARFSTKLTESSDGPFRLLACKFDSPRRRDGVMIRSYQLGIANPTTRTTYLLMFQSPVARWDETWAKGKVMLDHLAFDTQM